MFFSKLYTPFVKGSIVVISYRRSSVSVMRKLDPKLRSRITKGLGKKGWYNLVFWVSDCLSPTGKLRVERHLRYLLGPT